MYLGDDPVFPGYTQGIWLGRDFTTGFLNLFMCAGVINTSVDAGLDVPGRYHITYRRSGAVHAALVNAAQVVSVTQDQSAQTHTHLLAGTDTYAADWEPQRLSQWRVFSGALTDAEVECEMRSPVPVKRSALMMDTPLNGSLEDLGGNNFDWTASGGTIDFVDITDESNAADPVDDHRQRVWAAASPHVSKGGCWNAHSVDALTVSLKEHHQP
jgi:hypothetical protein